MNDMIERASVPRRDYILWTVLSCPEKTPKSDDLCPLSCTHAEEIESMTGDLATVRHPTTCPKCLRPVAWRLRNLFNSDGESVIPYCHGTVMDRGYVDISAEIKKIARPLPGSDLTETP